MGTFKTKVDEFQIYSVEFQTTKPYRYAFYQFEDTKVNLVNSNKCFWDIFLRHIEAGYNRQFQLKVLNKAGHSKELVQIKYHKFYFVIFCALIGKLNSTTEFFKIPEGPGFEPSGFMNRKH